MATCAVAIVSSLLVRQIYGLRYKLNPFTAEVEETYYNRDGSLLRRLKSILAVKADGSNVEIIYGVSPDGKPVERKSVVDVATSRRIVADGMTDSITTYHLPPEAMEAYRTKGGPCGDAEGSEIRVVLGHKVARVVKWRGQDRGEGVTLHSESWVASDLNCFPVEETILITPNGQPPRVSSVRKTQSIKLGSQARHCLRFVPIWLNVRHPKLSLNTRGAILSRSLVRVWRTR